MSRVPVTLSKRPRLSHLLESWGVGFAVLLAVALLRERFLQDDPTSENAIAGSIHLGSLLFSYVLLVALPLMAVTTLVAFALHGAILRWPLQVAGLCSVLLPLAVSLGFAIALQPAGAATWEMFVDLLFSAVTALLALPICAAIAFCCWRMSRFTDVPRSNQN